MEGLESRPVSDFEKKVWEKVPEFQAAAGDTAAKAEAVIEKAEAAPVIGLETAETAGATGLKLFATTTCPNCKIVAADMTKRGIAFDKVYADQNPAEARELGIKQAPTLVVMNGDKAVSRYTGVSEIRKYLSKLN